MGMSCILNTDSTVLTPLLSSDSLQVNTSPLFVVPQRSNGQVSVPSTQLGLGVLVSLRLSRLIMLVTVSANNSL
jgi:hypothetical protein